jgi:hypothetical protein
MGPTALRTANGRNLVTSTVTLPARARPELPRYRDRRGIALALVLCAQLMIILDLTVVNIALPSIATVCTSQRPAWPGCSTRTP